MNEHFSHEMLHSALAGKLPPADETALAAHLETCDACSAELERLVGEDEICREAPLFLIDDERDAALPIGEGWSEIDFVVEHLDPANEPDVLGRLGGYDVLEVIGRGGMGVVLKGYDRSLKRCVAIKVLAPHLAQSSLARQRFAREAQAAAAVVHPHVLAIHQVQAQGRLPFLVMPLVAGQSLAERIAEKGSLELKEILRIGMQAAAGLAAAHEQGLVHRDVKPANILLEKGVERAVLTDFGLARAADDVTLTRQGIIAGTPEYMSPEQARGEPLDARSDLFSLGSVLYQMASGVSPFRGDSIVATLRRLVDESPRSLASQNPELPPWLVAIVDRLLEKDPARRFGSAKEVSQLLEGCLAHVQQPATVVLPVGMPKSARRSFRRSSKSVIKGILAMTTALATVLLAFALLPGDIPDISGRWSGDDWGTVELKPGGTGEYTGTFSDTSSKGPGDLELKWSRVERRFNGTWREGENRFGQISIRLGDKEIRGAFTTDPKSKLNPATPALADLVWQRGERPSEPLAVARSENEMELEQKPEPVDDRGHVTATPVLTIESQEPPKLIAYSPDGKTVATAGSDLTVELFDAESGKSLAKFESINDDEQEFFKSDRSYVHKLRGKDWHVSALAFSPNSRTLAVASSVGPVKMFDARDGSSKGTVGALPRDRSVLDGVASVAFSPDGNLLVTSGAGAESVRFWDAKTFEPRPAITDEHNFLGGPVAFSPDGKLLVGAASWTASGEMVRGIKLRDGKTGELLKAWPLENRDDEIISISTTPDGTFLALGLVTYDKDRDRTVGAIEMLKKYEAKTGVELTVDYKSMVPRPTQVSHSPDGKYLAAFYGVNKLQVYAVGEAWGDIEPPNSTATEQWNCFAFAGDGNRIAIGGTIDGKPGVRIWELAEEASPSEPAADAKESAGAAALPAQPAEPLLRIDTDSAVNQVAADPTQDAR